MKNVNLERFYYGPACTLGLWTYEGGQCYTLEDPWKQNKVGVSCIPEGQYEMRRGNFKGLYENFELVFVPGRTAIEVHRGNSSADTHGCILLGQEVIREAGREPMLQYSKVAMTNWMNTMVGESAALLTILPINRPLKRI
jgi:uncharacterized protein DUF5675